jgi:hypothetical protein
MDLVLVPDGVFSVCDARQKQDFSYRCRCRCRDKDSGKKGNKAE